MFTITGAMGMGVHGGTENYEAKVRQTSQKLAQQGVILYIVDSKGIDLPSDQAASSRGPVPVRGRGRFEPQMDSEAISNDPRPAMELMASITGGRYMYNTNDLSAGFRQTAADMQGSYTLGFYMPGDPDDKWHKLKVKVKRSGVNVRHREGYLAELAPVQPVEWSTERWHAAFSNPIGSTVIPMTAKCERMANGELALSLLVDSARLCEFRPDGENLKADLEVAIAELTPEGAAHTNRATVQASVPAAESGEEARKAGVHVSAAVEARGQLRRSTARR